MPSQHELFLDPQKQRSRIAFHPLCSYVVSPSNEALGDSRHVFAPMFRSNLRQKKKSVFNQPVSLFLSSSPLLYFHVLSHGVTACKQFLFPHPVLPQGIEKNQKTSWPTLARGWKVVSNILLRGRPNWTQPFWGKTTGGLNSTWVGCRKMTQWLALAGRMLWVSSWTWLPFVPMFISLCLLWVTSRLPHMNVKQIGTLSCV